MAFWVIRPPPVRWTMPPEPSFEVVTSEEVQPATQLIFGVPHLGMAGVSATNYLVDHLDVDQNGHVDSTGIPAIAPFEKGEPRHPMRIYTSNTADLSVFVGELFIPVWAAEAFTEGFLKWVRESNIEEIILLYGVPFPHGHEEHKVYYTATHEFRDRNLKNSELNPLTGGFFDGVVAELMLRGLDGDAPPTGAFVTPSHPPGPDLDAALLLLDAIEDVCQLEIDEAELQESSEQMKQYYSEFADRLESLSQGEQSMASRDFPEDQMYM